MYAQNDSEFIDKRYKPSLGVTIETTEHSGGIMEGNKNYEKLFTCGGPNAPLLRVTIRAGDLVKYLKTHPEKSQFVLPGQFKIQQVCSLNPNLSVRGKTLNGIRSIPPG